jgi:hypothetical protein
MQARVAPGDASRAGASAASPAPWPNLVRLLVPPEQRECSNSGSEPRLEWRDVGGELEPVPSEGGPGAIATLPFEAPAELSVTASAASARSVVELDDGWLVAMDRGEFGAGLYWVERGTLRTRRIDSSLLHSVRWIGTTEFGIVGAAGLCHGDVCTQRTSLYSVVRSVDREWRLEPVTVFEGCPAVIGSAGSAGLLVAAACGGLQRIDRLGARTVASWPPHLYPVQVVGVRGSTETDEVYLVSFGRVAARFSGASAEWFALRHCIDVARDSDGRCSCVAEPP